MVIRAVEIRAVAVRGWSRFETVDPVQAMLHRAPVTVAKLDREQGLDSRD